MVFVLILRLNFILVLWVIAIVGDIWFIFYWTVDRTNDVNEKFNSYSNCTVWKLLPLVRIQKNQKWLGENMYNLFNEIQPEV